jgi:hypothetical protein
VFWKIQQFAIITGTAATKKTLEVIAYGRLEPL